MIDVRNFFDKSITNDLKTCHNIRKIAAGHGHDYTIVCLLDYPYFEKYCKLIAIDLSKQQKIDADPKAMQQIKFTGNLTRGEDAVMFFIIEKGKKTKAVLDFSKGTVKV